MSMKAPKNWLRFWILRWAYLLGENERSDPLKDLAMLKQFYDVVTLSERECCLLPLTTLLKRARFV